MAAHSFSGNRAFLRNVLWLAFFAAILIAWWMMFSMSTGMGLDLIGRPNDMAEAMRRMDPRMDMYMPMAEFGPLFWMWAIMMAAMMLPTMVPTLMAYEDLMVSANGTRAVTVATLRAELSTSRRASASRGASNSVSARASIAAASTCSGILSARVWRPQVRSSRPS